MRNEQDVCNMTTTAKASKPAATPKPKRISTVPKKSKEEVLTVKLGEDGSIPRVIVLGRGQLTGRKLYATRLPESTMDRLRSLVSAPDYLALQIAVERFCDMLEPLTTTEIIRADELG